ncbi:GNAT family N-acetyltransferase [Cupriavidus necator]|uniref:GNAT family N-acetyltransferase n=1 Tax=Cupriavidus necator TaxID=106590 RepID=UPI002ED9E80C
MITALPENQPHRADIAKILGRCDARRQGIAGHLMSTVDEVARAAGNRTQYWAGDDAERLFERTGWQRVGDVPNYSLMPDGMIYGTTFYHKQLSAHWLIRRSANGPALAS